MKEVFKKILKIVRNILICIFLSSILFTVLYRFVPVPLTPLMFIRSSGQLLKGEKIKLQKKWVSLENISPNLIQAVVAGEDNNFLSHFGFDFEAIKKAQVHNKNGKSTRGASTITQQTAKNVFLWPKRSYLRKGLEAYFTLLIELFWSKQRIMEVYLNVIETGNGIYGAEAASKVYFKKSAKNLNQNEAALISAILPNPRVWKADKPGPYVRHRKNLILRIMSKIDPVKFD